MPHPVTPQTQIRAAESTENIPSARRVRDVQRRILRLDPDAAPLTLLLARARKRSVSNSFYEWIEKDLEARWDAINNGAGYTNVATTFIVDNANRFLVGMVINIPRTGEKMRVTAVNTGANTIDVLRSVGGTAAAALLDNDAIQIIGNAQPEGGLAPAIKSHIESYPNNRTQIFREHFGVTGTESVSENYTGADRARLRAEKAVVHKIDIERSGWFGEKDIDLTSTDNPIRYTGGVLEFLAANVFDFAGQATEPEFESWSEIMFHHTGGSDTRTVFAAPNALSAINQLSVARIQTVPKQNVFGLSVTQYITAHGTLLLIKNRLFESDPSGVTTQGYGGFAVAVEPRSLGYVYMRERNTKLRMGIQPNDADREEDEYLTECGWQVELPRLHSVGKNLNS